MWTDGRYFIQIEKELYPGWQMKKMSRTDERLSEYILKNIEKNKKIAMDYNLFSKDQANFLMNELNEYEFIDDNDNIIDKIWGNEKPKYKEDKIIILPVKYTGLSTLEKYKIVVDDLKKGIEKLMVQKFGEEKKFPKIRLLISRLDDIAWVLNLRGSDIPYNPVFFSFGLLYSTENGEFFHLFSNKNKFNSPEIEKYLTENKITLHDYDEIYKVLSISGEDTLTVIDNDSTNCKMFNTVIQEKNGEHLIIKEDIIERIKGVKNQTEIDGYRKANIKDSVALIKFFSWLEDELVTKNRQDLNEYQIGLKNKQFREEQENFMGESFAPICAVGPNAAIIHYEQNENLHSDASKDKILLCDTGGQYLEGTTDITRTVHYGTPTDKEKEMFTRVLLGNLSLERLLFRKDITKLRELDSIPRSFLLMVGEDYNHGTSHGVVHFLNVHEGPHGLPLKEGNVITNEPGYYEKDAFGIRTENSVLVVKKDNDKLGFENLTYLPYERNLIDFKLLSPDFIKYIDEYHKKVFDTLSPYLKNDEKTLDYLKRKTAPLCSK
jgi:Xaa-Pro aminopeptidase